MPLGLPSSWRSVVVTLSSERQTDPLSVIPSSPESSWIHWGWALSYNSPWLTVTPDLPTHWEGQEGVLLLVLCSVIYTRSTLWWRIGTVDQNLCLRSDLYISLLWHCPNGVGLSCCSKFFQRLYWMHLILLLLIVWVGQLELIRTFCQRVPPALLARSNCTIVWISLIPPSVHNLLEPLSSSGIAGLCNRGELMAEPKR